MKKTETVNLETGEINTIFNVAKIIQTRRDDGSLREQQDFSDCPTLTEQHTAHLTNLNYLIERYKPDELAAYIAAREQYRSEIIGHDFSQELDMQDAKNVIYKSKQQFEELSDEIKTNFRSHLEFLKFIDNPQNAEKMLKLGILTKKELNNLQIPTNTPSPDGHPNRPLSPETESTTPPTPKP